MRSVERSRLLMPRPHFRRGDSMSLMRSLSQLLFRWLFPREYRVGLENAAWRYATVDGRKLASPGELVGNWWDEPDWEFVENGGDLKGDRVEENKGSCPCESDWTVELEDQDYNAKPNQGDITALFQLVKQPKLGTCSGECLPAQTLYGEWWMLWRNKKTGVFRLRCSKRVAWHCERVHS
jgi:hypothetical protein